MLDNFFYDETCNIYRVADAIDAYGYQKESQTLVYKNIGITRWRLQKWYGEQTPAVQMDMNYYEADIDGIYNDVLLWDVVVVSDTVGNDLWEYKVVDIRIYNDIEGTIDNVHLILHKKDGTD